MALSPEDRRNREKVNEAVRGAPRPSWFCPNGKPEEGDYSQADNDNRNRGHVMESRLRSNAMMRYRAASGRPL